MRLSRKKQIFIFTCLAQLFICFYIEYLSYYLNTRNWLKLECNNKNECTNILLVADPQIIGIHDVTLPPWGFLTPFTILDSDNYVKKTYKLAYDFTKPDIVIFLGDLMDEASTANNEEFYNYIRRIFKIFLPPSESHVKHIWLPGDNDIGGEGTDRITNEKIKRFNRAFSQPDLIKHKNITFFKINRLTNTIPIFKEKREFYDSNNIFVGLSHLPLMFAPSLFVDKVLTKMLPHVIFTAHEHKSMIISTDALLRQDRQIVPVNPDNNNKIYDFTLAVSDMYEFIVPTCSYRMGTNKIGYGFAKIEKNTLRYTVLWSPSRFTQLAYHLINVITFIIISIYLKYCFRRI